MTEVSVAFTKGDLAALRETLDQIPLFEGRAELREAIDGELRRHGDPGPLRVQVRSLSHLARRIILVDPESVRLRGKIARAVRSRLSDERALTSGRCSGETRGGVATSRRSDFWPADRASAATALRGGRG